MLRKYTNKFKFEIIIGFTSGVWTSRHSMKYYSYLNTINRKDFSPFPLIILTAVRTRTAPDSLIEFDFRTKLGANIVCTCSTNNMIASAMI